MENTKKASKEFLESRSDSTTSPREGDEALTRFAEHVVPGFPEITEDGRVLDRSREIYDNLGAIYGDQLDEESYHYDRESTARASPSDANADGTVAASTNPSTSAPPTDAGPSSAIDAYSISAPAAGPSRLGDAGTGSREAVVPHGRPLRREDAVIINPETGNRQPRPLKREGAVYLDTETPIVVQPIAGPSRISQVARISTGCRVPPRNRNPRPLRREHGVIFDVDTGNRRSRPLKREGAVYIGPEYTAIDAFPICDADRFDPGSPPPLGTYYGWPARWDGHERPPAILLDTDPRSGIEDLPTATAMSNPPALYSPLLTVPFSREAAPSPDVVSDFSDSPLTPLTPLSSAGNPTPPPPPAAVATAAPSPAGSGDRKGKKRARDEDELADDDNATASGSGSVSAFGTQQLLTDGYPKPSPPKKAKRTHPDTPASTPDRKGKKRARDDDEDEQVDGEGSAQTPKIKVESDSESPSPSKKLKITIPPLSAFTTPTQRDVMSVSHLCGIEAGPSRLATSPPAPSAAAGRTTTSPPSPPPPPAAAAAHAVLAPAAAAPDPSSAAQAQAGPVAANTRSRCTAPCCDLRLLNSEDPGSQRRLMQSRRVREQHAATFRGMSMRHHGRGRGGGGSGNGKGKGKAK